MNDSLFILTTIVLYPLSDLQNEQKENSQPPLKLIR